MSIKVFRNENPFRCQNVITEIATAQDFRFSNATSQLATESGNEDYIEILKKHSELGDMGIISSEELEFKKKQLLGL